MNTLIKRGIKVAVTLIFIGAAVVPACAQNKKGLVKSVEKALERKITVKTPTVRVAPVTPRVPPTLQGGALVPTHAVSNENTLNASVKREKISRLSQKTLQKVLQTNIISHKDQSLLTSMPPYWMFGRNSEREYFVSNLDGLGRWRMTRRHIPNFVPIENITIRPTDEDAAIIQVRNRLLERSPSDKSSWESVRINPIYKYKEEELRSDMIAWEQHNVGHYDAVLIEAVITVLKKVDNYFFIEREGQVFVRMWHFTGNSYGEVLSKLAREINHKKLYHGLNSNAITDFIRLRDRQIIEAFEKNEGINSLEPDGTVNVTDYSYTLRPRRRVRGQKLFEGEQGITTRRTAEEIKFLVKNLDPKNPLRQTIEHTLEILEKYGEIFIEISTLQSADITTQRTAEEIQSLVENLDPQNPLRQAVESTLKENGYITPEE